MRNENIQRLLAAAKNLKPGGTDGEWTCYCPVHEADGGTHTNSLSVLAGDDGKIVVNCHNGCDPKEVIYAFGLIWKDCFPQKESKSSQITATYDYRDDDTVLRFQVCRIEPGKDGRKKDFRQRQPTGDPNNPWTWKTKGLKKFPYRLPELNASSRDQLVYIVEGEKQVDYLRSLGLIATCNPGGAGKWLKSYAKYFASRDVVVIPDADEPNPNTGKIVGAAHAKDVADSLIGIANSIRVVELPGALPKWGLDDWLQAGNTIDSLKSAIESTAQWGPTSTIVTQVPIGASDEAADPLEYHRKILNDIGIVYCAEMENGEIEVFSSVTKKFSIIRDPGKLNYARLTQVAGWMAERKVRCGDDDTGDFSIREVRIAIAVIAGAGKRGSEKMGSGIWRLNDKTVLVNGTSIAIFDGKTLTQSQSAVYEDHVFDIGSHSEWFNFDEVAKWVHSEDRGWIADSFLTLCGILAQWKYRTPDGNDSICSDIVASLIVGSLLQSFWIFRPMVFLLGESNCGKSTLLQFLCGEETNPLDNGLLGSLAIHSSNQSAAGIRQMAEHSSRPVFVDEFEKGRHRTEILELLRGASRGSQSIRGTAGQKAVLTKLAFIAWAASTESGLVKQVDQNRWIQIQMIAPPAREMGKLRLPSIEETTDLKHKLIAAAILIGNDARKMVEPLMERRPKEIDHRICHLYAVPAAVYATITGMSGDDAAKVHAQMLSIHDTEQMEKDHESALDVILTSKIRTGHSDRSLLSLIHESNNGFVPGIIEHEELLATYGVKVFSKDGKPWVFFVHRIIMRELLRGSSLDGSKIDELLLRLPRAVRDQLRLSGKPLRGVSVPMDIILPPEQKELFTEV